MFFQCGAGRLDAPGCRSQVCHMTKEAVASSDDLIHQWWTGGSPVHLVISVLRIRSCHQVPRICLWHFIWNDSRLLVSVATIMSLMHIIGLIRQALDRCATLSTTTGIYRSISFDGRAQLMMLGQYTILCPINSIRWMTAESQDIQSKCISVDHRDTGWLVTGTQILQLGPGP